MKQIRRNAIRGAVAFGLVAAVSGVALAALVVVVCMVPSSSSGLGRHPRAFRGFLLVLVAFAILFAYGLYMLIGCLYIRAKASDPRKQKAIHDIARRLEKMSAGRLFTGRSALFSAIAEDAKRNADEFRRRQHDERAR